MFTRAPMPLHVRTVDFGSSRIRISSLAGLRCWALGLEPLRSSPAGDLRRMTDSGGMASRQYLTSSLYLLDPQLQRLYR